MLTAVLGGGFGDRAGLFARGGIGVGVGLRACYLYKRVTARACGVCVV